MIKITVRIIGQTSFPTYSLCLHAILRKFEFFLTFIFYGQTPLLITINN